MLNINYNIRIAMIFIKFLIFIKENQGYEIFVYPGSFTWQQAKQKCESHNQTLAKIENEAKHWYIAKMLEDNYGSNTVWFGFKSTTGTDLTSWEWIDGSKRLKWQLWHPSDPNGSGAACARFEHRTDYNLNKYVWLDAGCSSTFYALCENPLAWDVDILRRNEYPASIQSQVGLISDLNPNTCLHINNDASTPNNPILLVNMSRPVKSASAFLSTNGTCTSRYGSCSTMPFLAYIVPTMETGQNDTSCYPFCDIPAKCVQDLDCTFECQCPQNNCSALIILLNGPSVCHLEISE